MNHRPLLIAIAAGLAGAMPLTAQITFDPSTAILLDMQSDYDGVIQPVSATTTNDGTATTWNTIEASPLVPGTGFTQVNAGSVSNLSRADGTATTIGVAWSTGWGQISSGASNSLDNVVEFAQQPAWEELDMYEDGWYAMSDIGSDPTVTFSGLTPGGFYTIVVHAQRHNGNAGDHDLIPSIQGAALQTAYSVYTLAQTPGGTATLATSGATGNFSTSDAYDTFQYITLDFQADPTGTAVFHSGVTMLDLNFPFIEGMVLLPGVPEPALASLVLGGLALVQATSRRRRR